MDRARATLREGRPTERHTRQQQGRRGQAGGASLPEPRIRPFGFTSPAPIVRLVHAFDRPYENVVATARTCYSAKGIVTEDQASAKPDRRDAIARSIYEAGHHTT